MGTSPGLRSFRSLPWVIRRTTFVALIVRQESIDNPYRKTLLAEYFFRPSPQSSPSKRLETTVVLIGTDREPSLS